MGENKPFASRYIETGAGTALAFASVVKAIVSVIVFATAASMPESGSLLFGMVGHSLRATAAITMILDVLMAVGLVLMRYKNKGDGLVYLVLIVNLIMAIIAAVPLVIAGTSGFRAYIPDEYRQYFILTALLIILFFVAAIGYYYACLKLLKVVRTEIKQNEPVTSKFRNAVPLYCIAILVVTVAEAVSTYTSDWDLTNIITPLFNAITYGCLYAVAKKFNQEHKNITAPSDSSASADTQK